MIVIQMMRNDHHVHRRMSLLRRVRQVLLEYPSVAIPVVAGVAMFVDVLVVAYELLTLRLLLNDRVMLV